jgi:ABC-type transporter Mla subunit MlaD
MEEIRLKSDEDGFVILNSIAGMSLEITEQLAFLKDDREVIKEVVCDAAARQSGDIARSTGQLEDAIKKNAPKPVDFSEVLDAIGKVDLDVTPITQQIDDRHSDTCKFLKISLLHPLLDAIQKVDLDLTPVLESTNSNATNLMSIMFRQESINKAVSETRACVADIDISRVLEAIPPPTDLSPISEAIASIELHPEVHVHHLQEVLDALANVCPDLRQAIAAATGEISTKADTDVDKLAFLISKLDSNFGSHSQAVFDTMSNLKQSGEVHREDTLRAMSQDREQVLCELAQATSEVQQVKDSIGRMHTAVDRELIAGILPVVHKLATDLDPVSRRLAEVSSSMNAHHRESIAAIKDIHVDPIDFAPILRELEKSRAVSSQLLQNMDVET